MQVGGAERVPSVQVMVSWPTKVYPVAQVAVYSAPDDIEGVEGMRELFGIDGSLQSSEDNLK